MDTDSARREEALPDEEAPRSEVRDESETKVRIGWPLLCDGEVWKSDERDAENE
jgi:hypothetical protein